MKNVFGREFSELIFESVRDSDVKNYFYYSAFVHDQLLIVVCKGQCYASFLSLKAVSRCQGMGDGEKKAISVSSFGEVTCLMSDVVSIDWLSWVLHKTIYSE